VLTRSPTLSLRSHSRITPCGIEGTSSPRPGRLHGGNSLAGRARILRAARRTTRHCVPGRCGQSGVPAKAMLLRPRAVIARTTGRTPNQHVRLSISDTSLKEATIRAPFRLPDEQISELSPKHSNLRARTKPRPRRGQNRQPRGANPESRAMPCSMLQCSSHCRSGYLAASKHQREYKSA